MRTFKFEFKKHILSIFTLLHNINYPLFKKSKYNSFNSFCVHLDS